MTDNKLCNNHLSYCSHYLMEAGGRARCLLYNQPVSTVLSMYPDSIVCDYFTTDNTSKVTTMHNQDDKIDKPTHYQIKDGVEVIDAIIAAGYGEGFLVGSAIKYLLRANRKGGQEDIAKAAKCLRLLVEKGLI